MWGMNSISQVHVGNIDMKWSDVCPMNSTHSITATSHEYVGDLLLMKPESWSSPGRSILKWCHCCSHNRAPRASQIDHIWLDHFAQVCTGCLFLWTGIKRKQHRRPLLTHESNQRPCIWSCLSRQWPSPSSAKERDPSWHLPVLPISYSPSGNISHQEKFYIPVNCRQSPKIDGVTLACHDMLSTDHLTAALQVRRLCHILCSEKVADHLCRIKQASNAFWPIVETSSKIYRKYTKITMISLACVVLSLQEATLECAAL